MAEYASLFRPTRSADARSSCGEFEDFGLRGDVEHDAAPLAVERRHDALRNRIGAGADDMHRQAAERAVRMRRVLVHAREHGLAWLSKGKRGLLGAAARSAGTPEIRKMMAGFRAYPR
jgi:hypothetical protein